MTTGDILSGGGEGPRAPLVVSGDQPERKAGRIRAAIDPERDLICARLPLTDLGNAERWRVRFGDDFRFCAELGWLHWQGARWKLLSEEKDKLPAEVMQSVFTAVRAIRNEGHLIAATGALMPNWLSDRSQPLFFQISQEVKDDGLRQYLRHDEDGSRAAWLADLSPQDMLLDLGKRKFTSSALAAWAKTSEGMGKLNSVATIAKSFPEIAIRHDQLDADPMAINVSNGTLRFVRNSVKRSSEEIAAGKSEWKVDGWKVKREPHRRDDLITKLAPVKFSPTAKAPEYDAFLERVQPDPTMRRFIHQWGGYSLTGDTGEQKLAFFYGSGRNGKGTWVEAVAAIAGDYAGSVGIETFLDNGTKRRGDQATPDIARLPGVRMLRLSEPEKRSSLNEGLIKQVTGQDPVDARHLNKGFFTFMPQFKITVSGNHKPTVKDDSDGIWRRMQLVPWGVQIPADQVDRKLGDKLRAEASGMLNRLIEGLLDWMQHGLIEPEAVRMATSAYREASDDIGRFLTAICEVGETCRCSSKELHQLYQAWAEAAGGAIMHIKAFKTAMEGKGFVQKQSDGMKWLKVQPRFGVHIDQVKLGEWPAPIEPVPAPPAVAERLNSGVDGPAGDPEGGAGGSDLGADYGDLDDWGIDPSEPGE